MTTLSFVGTRECGKSTCLGLLHQALTIYSMLDKNFRYGPTMMSTGYLNENITHRLLTGDFPIATAPGRKEEISLSCEFKKRKIWRKLIINIYDISGEEFDRINRSIADSNTDEEVLNALKGKKYLQSILSSEIIIFIVDCLHCDPQCDKETAKKRVKNDLNLQQLWLTIMLYKEIMKLNLSGVALMFSKYDKGHMFVPLDTVNYHSVRNLNRSELLLYEAHVDPAKFRSIAREFLPYTFSSLLHDLHKIGKFNVFRSGLHVVGETMNKPAGEPAIPLTFTLKEYIRLLRWVRFLS